ncbi:putative iron-regulated membrane protein [Polymorphobacter multimanifer]|uniref:Putative iron-regulated membrane protein n=1 Tax=Polymorphobacter multimanifer TaxID=1070431 RepID=A0A841LA40_9SPHN|nr:PepSY-associated TM helix domain-containing protein [Polymorphobacter multimanifer]MBB6229300.1 putative iron-regulated membrane protein [Polymorphobacter multimanifer]
MNAQDKGEPGSFRLAMNQLHTWAGVVIGGVLFAIFWMGTLSVFDREIDRWMMPMTRIAQTEVASLDALKPIADRMARDVDQWSVVLPTERVPTMQLRVYEEERDINDVRHVDPATGALLDDPGSLGGTGFFFPFHFSLHLRAFDLGYWLVGIAAMAMLVLSVSGVIIHKKLFADFFTLRIVRKPQRTTLDLHNVTGVLGLPFNIVMALSGLIIFFSIYMPTPQSIVYGGDKAAFERDAYGDFEREKAGRPGGLASLDAMQAEAKRRWDGEAPYFVRVKNPGDANAYVEMRRPYDRGVTMSLDKIYFDGPTGRVLNEFRTDKAVMTAQRFISGIHFIQFRHWTLRWLYFVCGLMGCVLIATGFLFWVQSRRKKHAKLGLRGVAVVEGLAVGSTTGIVIATLGFLIANRLLPLGIEGRAGLEMWAFYLIWIGTFAHGWLRPRRAWVDQSWAIATGAVLAVILNAITTGDHPIHAALRGQWGVAGMDLVMLAGGAVAVLTALRLSGRKAATPVAALAPAE